MVVTEEYITHALVHNGYDEATAADRAPLVCRFFDVAQLEQRLVAHPSLRPIRQLEFLTGDLTCSVENADVVSDEIILPAKTEWLGGTWLESAPLTYLARVCDIACHVLGKDWLIAYQARLLNRSELLDTLNEIWWLGCWKNIGNVISEPKAQVSGDNDWQLTLQNGVKINLQVKRRRNDLNRLRHYTRPPYGIFDKLSKRFSPSSSKEINVGAITIYGGITNSVMRAVDDYFLFGDSHNVDAVILWCPGIAENVPPYFLRARKLSELLYATFSLDPIDRLYTTCNEHPISMSEARDGE